MVDPATSSAFDLSAAEKLQLVEDLWDDLASSPEEVRIHEWLKQELDRRKSNLTDTPASGVSWEDIKQKLGHWNDR